jgi:hypothetical protein
MEAEDQKSKPYKRDIESRESGEGRKILTVGMSNTLNSSIPRSTRPRIRAYTQHQLRHVHVHLVSISPCRIRSKCHLSLQKNLAYVPTCMISFIMWSRLRFQPAQHNLPTMPRQISHKRAHCWTSGRRKNSVVSNSSFRSRTSTAGCPAIVVVLCSQWIFERTGRVFDSAYI